MLYNLKHGLLTEPKNDEDPVCSNPCGFRIAIYSFICYHLIDCTIDAYFDSR